MSGKRAARPRPGPAPTYPTLSELDRRSILVGVGGLLLLGGAGCVQASDPHGADAGTDWARKESTEVLKGKVRPTDLPQAHVADPPRVVPETPREPLGGTPPPADVPGPPPVPLDHRTGGAKRVSDVPRRATDAGPPPPKDTP